MKILNLHEAESLKKVLFVGESWSVWQERAKWLYVVRILYKKGFSICTGENVLWDTVREMIDDLTKEA